MLLILFLLVPSALAQISVDFNCSSWRGADLGFKYDWQAVSCGNFMSDATCKLLYPSDVYPEEGGSSSRPIKCYSKDNTPNRDEATKEQAVLLCPKTCGFCCETRSFRCMDRNVLINCATVTKAQCQYPAWRDILTEECPATCGYCEYATGCVDTSPDCQIPGICTKPGMEGFTYMNCKKTCYKSYRTTNMPTFTNTPTPAATTSTPRATYTITRNIPGLKEMKK